MFTGNIIFLNHNCDILTVRCMCKSRVAQDNMTGGLDPSLIVLIADELR